MANAAAGSGAVVVIETPALDRTAALAEDAGLRVLVARADERDRASRFAVALRLLRPALERLNDRERAAALTGAAGLAEPLLHGGTPQSRDELALMHGLYWLVSNLADRTPLALLVEDAQWADEPSLRLFAYLAQRIEELPVALVVARGT